MARSKTVKSYPAQFMEMLDAIHEDPAVSFDIPCEDAKAAKNLMLTFQAFRGAALREELTSMYPDLMALYVCMLKDQPGIRVMHRDYSPEALLVQKALDAARAKKAVEQVTILERMRKE